jgi:hypothetical protein
MEQTYSFRPAYGQALTIGIGIVAILSLTFTAPSVGIFLRYLGPAIFVTALTWALFWRPVVKVGDDGVTIRNVLQTVAMPWQGIEWVDTKYALTLGHADTKYTAWAAPAPGLAASKRAQRADKRNLPKDTYVGGSIRPGDLASSLSGQAAMLIRRQLEQLPPSKRDTGTAEPVRKAWNIDVVAVLAVTAAWSAISLFM